jgi:hypothetical protein
MAASLAVRRARFDVPVRQVCKSLVHCVEVRKLKSGAVDVADHSSI